MIEIDIGNNFSGEFYQLFLKGIMDKARFWNNCKFCFWKLQRITWKLFTVETTLSQFADLLQVFGVLDANRKWIKKSHTRRDKWLVITAKLQPLVITIWITLHHRRRSSFWFDGLEANIDFFQQNLYILDIFNYSHPNLVLQEKVNLNFYFHTSLRYLKKVLWRFYRKDLHKTFWRTTKKCENKKCK